MLKRKKTVQEENHDTFIRLNTDDQVREKLYKMYNQRVAYEVWRKGEVEMKTRTGKARVIKKIKLIQKEKELAIFVHFFQKEIDEFRKHVF